MVDDTKLKDPEPSMVFICRANYTTIRQIRRPCTTCERKRNFVATFEPWYGWTFTCLGCGDSWQDGERMQRPFMRGWRVKEIERAKRLLDNRTERQKPKYFAIEARRAYGGN